MTAREIQWLLATRLDSPFYARRQSVVVPNVSWGMFPWEADLLAVSRAGYLTEIEIKVSLSDWRAEAKKWRWKDVYPRQESIIKRYYFAVPAALAARHEEVVFPDLRAGVIAVTPTGIEVLKEAETWQGHRQLTTMEINQLYRLAALKAWNLAHKPASSDDTPEPSE